MLPRGFPRTHLVAHRGLATKYPENSLPALEQAAAVGARIIEFDIQLSSDHVPMVIHDADLRRTTGRVGAVGAFSAAELGRVGCGYAERFADEFESLKICSLDQIVAVMAQIQRSYLLAEIKDESIARFGLQTCMEAVLTALAPVRARTVLISFSQAAVRYAQNAGWPVGWCLDAHDSAAREFATTLGPELLLTDQRALTSADDLWPGVWKWASWEVLDPRRALELMSFGLDYVETMGCDDLLANAELARAMS
jgi:glycerophosphoryl diester phosphodiesterase